ncbi:hypothetical protein [Endozoicomonas sp. 4G]|uniref:hypothetical protein n=1 Tax=Endozoicomonas sp. 4G TaxID=2872754 RepID=UPI0020791E3F|nr:hypothetical protein [Endozoicomonas sp. 4G]
MKPSGKRILVFSCLLFICSIAHSGVSREEQFHLLSYYNNASLVEDGLKLATSSSGLAASTLINYGLWYGICKAPGPVAALTGRFAGTEQNELQEVKSSFCNKLAAVLTSTEIALAGRVSPWPLETPWWQPLRFVGTAYAGYEAYNNEHDPYLIPIITAGFFTSEVVARTVAASTVIRAFRYSDKDRIQPLDYVGIEYSTLSSIAGMMIGTIIYEKMMAGGSSLAKAAFAYATFHALVEVISAISPLSIHNSDCVDPVETEAGAGAESLAGVGALAGSWAIALSATLNVVFSSSRLSGVAAVATAFAAALYAGHNYAYAYVGALTTMGTAIGAYTVVLFQQQHSRLDSNHVVENVALTLPPALALALINGVSNNVVYGYPLEESFTDTAWIQWQKFYAPLDYLRTLFN